ncbi:MAG TPA: aminoglycoside phosphotransferase family protein [Blastocatellia bacterium]|nr:aminoglycoside phosphotransferase family protein [Blastocatellia bacterium]
MADSDPRILHLIEVEHDQIQALLYPALKGATIACVERLGGGLVNTLYRITPSDGSDSLCLRIFAAGRLSWETERKVLALVSASLPVPNVLLADGGNSDFSHPYLVYRWIEGITLNEFRRQAPPAALLSVAETLGRLLAGVASFSFADGPNGEPNGVHSRLSPIEALLSINEKMLLSGLARKRLGSALADAMWRRLEASADRLCKLDSVARLVHGDFGGRNILVAPSEDGGWRVSGLIDWEGAFSGSTLWDVGSLFSYPRRYSETFRQLFERGYRDAGGTLPEDWFRTARLLDSTKMVTTLNEERELPVVFAECRELIDAIIAEGV